MNFDNFLAFLEPTDKRAGAMCQSASDWNDTMEALQKACRLLNNACSPELKQSLDSAASRFEELQRQARRK